MSNRIISPQLVVRLVPDLSAAAFKTNQVKELALWHCLRALNHWGSGSLPLEMAIDGLQSVFGYSKRTIDRHMAAGEGLFWQRKTEGEEIRRTTIKIYGLGQVCLMLDTNLPGTKRFYDVGPDRFQRGMDQKSRLWESLSFHKAKGVKAKPISRATIQDITGINSRQQRRYDRASDVKQANNWRPDMEQPRLPNSYHHKQTPGNTGQLRKLRKRLKSFIADEAFEPKRYFVTSIAKIVKARNKAEPVFRLRHVTKRKIRGRLEWEPVICLALH